MVAGFIDQSCRARLSRLPRRPAIGNYPDSHSERMALPWSEHENAQPSSRFRGRRVAMRSDAAVEPHGSITGLEVGLDHLERDRCGGRTLLSSRLARPEFSGSSVAANENSSGGKASTSP